MTGWRRRILPLKKKLPPPEEHSKSILLKESIEGQIAVLREQIRSEQLNEENRKERISSIDQELLGKEEQKQEYEKQREETKSR